MITGPANAIGCISDKHLGYEHYRKSFSFAPSLFYGCTYYATRNMQHDTLLARWFHLFGAQKLREVIEEEQPDIIVNTFPMLVMPMLRKMDGITIPTVTVLTDFDLHNRWARKRKCPLSHGKRIGHYSSKCGRNYRSDFSASP